MRRGYAAAGLVVNDLTAVRVLPALDWWAARPYTRHFSAQPEPFLSL